MITICGDAGHGGKDSGAVGFGTEEADIALAVLTFFGIACRRQGWKFVPTRTSDTYPTLAQRCAIANAAGADRFGSFHFDWASSAAARGISVLCYDSADSRDLAARVFKAIEPLTPYVDRGVIERSDLAVLNGTNMTAVLVEGGFISNSAEHAMMLSRSYQINLAERTCQAFAGDLGQPYIPPVAAEPPSDAPLMLVASVRPSKLKAAQGSLAALGITSAVSRTIVPVLVSSEVARRLPASAEAAAAAFIRQ